MNEIQPLLDALTAKHGWIATIVTWTGLLRYAAHPFGAWLQTAMSKLIVNDPEAAVKFTTCKTYRVTAFLVDLICSVKLPSAKSVSELAAKAQAGANTEEITKALLQ